MGRFYKTHTRWMSNTPVKKAVAAPVEQSSAISKEAPVDKKPIKEDIPEVIAPKEDTNLAEDAPAVMFIEKTKTEEGITCKIIANTDYDEIRYNVGSKKVTEKNKSRCKRYEGEFTLEEDSVVNASAFKDDILVCSVQG